MEYFMAKRKNSFLLPVRDSREKDFSELTPRLHVGSGVGKAVNRVFEALNNAFELEFYECADVMFDCRGRNTHSFNRLFCVLSVEGEPSWVSDCSGNVSYSMKPGCFYLVGSQTDFSFTFHPGTHFLAFHFHLRLFHDQELLGAEPFLSEIPDRMAEIRRLRELLYSEELSAGVLCELRAVIFRELAPFLSRVNLENQCRNYRKYQAVLDFLHTEGSAKTTIDDLADRCLVTRDTLSRGFSRDFGIPLKRYISKTLASNAEKLLRDPSLKIGQVAQRLQFTDEYYFSRFFKKMTGTTPSEFRRFNQACQTQRNPLPRREDGNDNL